MKTIRIVSFALAFLMVITGLTACGSDEPQTSGTSSTVSGTTTATTLENAAVSTTGTQSGEPTVSETVSQDVTTVTEPAASTTTGAAVSTAATKPTGGNKVTTTAATTVKTTVTTQPQSKPPVKPNPVKLTALSTDEYYGYQYLAGNGGSTAVYECVASGIEKMQDEISLENTGVALSEKDLKSVMRCYHADYPQHFWYNGAYSYVMNGSGEVLSVKPTYTMTTSQKQTAQQKVDKAVKDLLEKAAYGQTEYDRELILHDALADRVKYVDGTNAHNLYGALVEGKAVCEGYARAFQYLLYQAGMQCLFVEGTSVRPGSSKGEAHAWNVVKINGKYYHTDVTWDDQSDSLFSVIHAFFDLNDAFIKEGHTISADNPYPIPSCNSTNDSYFVHENIELKTFTVDKIAELFVRGNGTATIYLSKNTVNEFLTWFQANLSDISAAANLKGKSFSIQYCGREVIITTK
ncbi:MAG: hypothetical protein J6K62_02580 [Clostridia bacterium]|nr:hypothetical protein [Clostridia bacterium]